MKVLLGTDIFLHREIDKKISQDIESLYRLLDRNGFTRCIHWASIVTAVKKTNSEQINSVYLRLNGYDIIENTSSSQKTDDDGLCEDLDCVDSDAFLLNAIQKNYADYLITENKVLFHGAGTINLCDRVFTIKSFLEKILKEPLESIDYKILNVRKIKFNELNLNDPFFDSLREDYPGFNEWFQKKGDESAYVMVNSKDRSILSFLYLKLEYEKEDYSDINPPFSHKRRLKIGTFKVIKNGFRLGERFLKMIFDNALKNQTQEIYVTTYNHRPEQCRLIELLKIWGFSFWGMKGKEQVYVRDFTPNFNVNDLNGCFPFISKKRNIFIVPIYPRFHTELFPDSILNNELPDDYKDDCPHRNCIQKVYVSRALGPYPNSGDVIIFYRTGGYFKGVLTTIGIVQNIEFNFNNEEEYISYCKKKCSMPENVLREWWRQSQRKPFVVDFLYVYSFPVRLNLKKLIEMKILSGLYDAPRGFRPILKTQFDAIIKESNSDESFIVD